MQHLLAIIQIVACRSRDRAGLLGKIAEALPLRRNPGRVPRHIPTIPQTNTSHYITAGTTHDYHGSI